MLNWINELSDHDDKEKARVQTVTRLSSTFFETLVTELRRAASDYNSRHPRAETWQSAAVTDEIAPFASTSLGITLTKNTETKGSAEMRYELNTGAIQVDLIIGDKKHFYSIPVIPIGETVSFFVNCGPKSTPELVEFLLKDLLFHDTLSALQQQAVN